MKKHNSQGWQQTPVYHNAFHQGQNCNQDYSQNDGGGSGDVARDSGAPAPSSSSYGLPPQYGNRNSMCPPPHQRQMFQLHMHQMQSRAMMTLSPHQMCMLQRENPEAYTLIQQQRLEIYQHRVELDKALKEVSRLRHELEERSTVKGSVDGNEGKEEKKLDVKNDDKPVEENEVGDSIKDRENTPPEINLQKTRSNSPSSQLTDISQDSLPTKKRILESAQQYKAPIFNHESISKTKPSNNEADDLHHAKKMKPSLTDLARIGVSFSSVTSPLHNGFAHDGHTPKKNNHNSRRTALPDIATVAARLSAATSPKFHRGSRRHYVNSSFPF
mmetsp:Transcript_22170/g.27987  ORF Transcript_22170/g.27987 Transcript_22170/m.27987 type:complete len:329 (+) Transcript_22170:81-1067(+)